MNEMINPSALVARLGSFKYYRASASLLCKLLHPLCATLFRSQLCYLLTVSSVGYLALAALAGPSTDAAAKPGDLDLFFTSVSAATLSSMTALEMEVFSDTQLVVLVVLMIFGGEVFVSVIQIQIIRYKAAKTATLDLHGKLLKQNSLRVLSYVVVGYFLVINVVGSLLVYSYVRGSPTLVSKGIRASTFSVFATVSSFTNCGFIPTNENMIVFKADSDLLFLLVVQILLGNTLYPVSLRLTIWAAERTTKRRELGYLLSNSREIGYEHLLSGPRAKWHAVTVSGFFFLQIALFCATEWGSEAMAGLSASQKLSASLFQVVNSRHAGESVLDLSAVSAAVLVLFAIMMYLPLYTSYYPKGETEEESSSNNEENPKKKISENLRLSQLSYLAIFITMVCVTERGRIRSDPLNFSIFNIIFEIVSAYGNVGFSTGYSCERQVIAEQGCVDRWYGLVGRWSPSGKVILIIVMFFGRLKKFTFGGGKAWRTS